MKVRLVSIIRYKVLIYYLLLICLQCSSFKYQSFSSISLSVNRYRTFKSFNLIQQHSNFLRITSSPKCSLTIPSFSHSNSRLYGKKQSDSDVTTKERRKNENEHEKQDEVNVSEENQDEDESEEENDEMDASKKKKKKGTKASKKAKAKPFVNNKEENGLHPHPLPHHNKEAVSSHQTQEVEEKRRLSKDSLISTTSTASLPATATTLATSSSFETTSLSSLQKNNPKTINLFSSIYNYFTIPFTNPRNIYEFTLGEILLETLKVIVFHYFLHRLLLKPRFRIFLRENFFYGLFSLLYIWLRYDDKQIDDFLGIQEDYFELETDMRKEENREKLRDPLEEFINLT
jgi:hypothetical protein